MRKGQKQIISPIGMANQLQNISIVIADKLPDRA